MSAFQILSLPHLVLAGQSAWLVVLCLMLGAAYSLTLYFREKKFELPKYLRVVAGLLRGLFVSVIAFLLLSPAISIESRIIEEPIIIVAQDNSASLRLGSDSAFYLNHYPDRMNNLLEELITSYEVRTLSFSGSVDPGIDFSFDGKVTDISNLLTHVANHYTHMNVGALVLATDGIHNHGIDPMYAAHHLGFPVYVIALGDTTIKRDLAAAKVVHNRITYRGNRFPVQIIVNASMSDGLSTNLTIERYGKTLHSETLFLTGQDFTREVEILLKADSVGKHEYQIQLSPLTGEANTANNNLNFFVEVLETRHRVLFLFNSPHPDISALRQSLERTGHYETSVQAADDFDGNISPYNLVILHGLPSKQNPSLELFDQLRDQKIPALIIINHSTSTELLDVVRAGLSIRQTRDLTDDALPLLNEGFGLFTLSQEVIDLIPTLPPLTVKSGIYRPEGGARIMLYQKIGQLASPYPLLLFTERDGVRRGIIVGEGIWRWQLSGFQRKNNHTLFDEIISKVVQYVAIREEKRRFRASTDDSWLENQRVEIIAELYNESYEPVTGPEVIAYITSAGGDRFEYTFSRAGSVYRLNAGFLQPGEYQFVASTEWEGQRWTASGEFTVLPLQLEQLSNVANHGLLYRLAERYGGEMILPGHMDRLPQLLADRNDIKPIVGYSRRYRDLIDLTWLMFTLILLMGLEWALRRSSGAY